MLIFEPHEKTYSEPQKKYLSEISGSQIHDNYDNKWTVKAVQNCPKYQKWSDTVQYGPKCSRRVIWICGPKISVKYFFLGHPVRAKSMYYLYMYRSKYLESNM